MTIRTMSAWHAIEMRPWTARIAAGCAFVAALALYCELHSIVTGRPLPGLQISLPWALQVSAGWLLACAVLARFGSPARRAAIVQRHPYLSGAGAAFLLGMLALTCELAIRAAAVPGEQALAAFLYARFPIALLGGLVLVAGYLLLNRSTDPTLPASVAAAESLPAIAEQPAPVPQSTCSGELLEVMTGTGHTKIRLADVEYLRADRNYISIVHSSGRTYLLRETMAALERRLEGRAFARIHRSLIVNLEMVQERRRGGVFVMRGGDVVQASRAHRKRTGSAVSAEPPPIAAEAASRRDRVSGQAACADGGERFTASRSRVRVAERCAAVAAAASRSASATTIPSDRTGNA